MQNGRLPLSERLPLHNLGIPDPTPYPEEGHVALVQFPFSQQDTPKLAPEIPGVPPYANEVSRHLTFQPMTFAQPGYSYPPSLKP